MKSSPGKTAKNKKKRKKKYSGQQQKEMDWDEPHPAPNEKMQPNWTERPTSALVAAGSLWPTFSCMWTDVCLLAHWRLFYTHLYETMANYCSLMVVWNSCLNSSAGGLGSPFSFFSLFGVGAMSNFYWPITTTKTWNFGGFQNRSFYWRMKCHPLDPSI